MNTESPETATGIYDMQNEKYIVRGYGASGGLIGGEKLKPMDIERSPTGADEVKIEVMYCGVCHSDLHQVANDWKNTIYPCVPGHEIIGKVVETGAEVTRFSVGDIVGVGCMIDSCQQCESCLEGEEQHCQGKHGPTMTYNGYFVPDQTKFNTFGGYSTHVVAKENFVLEIPAGLDPKSAAPILCAGVTTWSPLVHWQVGEGDVVGVVGIGGLGHMGVKLAKAMGAMVIAITTREEKREAALDLGADEVLVSEDETAMEQRATSIDYILVTIPDPFDVNPYIRLLKPRGELVTVGLLAPYKVPTDNMEVAKLSRKVGGSLIGGVAATQDVLDFCAEHGLLPEVQMIAMDEINDAFENMKKEEVRFRYVIDMASLTEQE